MAERPRPSDDEMKQLRAEMATRFPNWQLVGVGSGYGDYYVCAERMGTHPDRQAASTPAELLEALERREMQLRSSRPNVVPVHTGLESTATRKIDRGEQT